MSPSAAGFSCASALEQGPRPRPSRADVRLRRVFRDRGGRRARRFGSSTNPTRTESSAGWRPHVRHGGATGLGSERGSVLSSARVVPELVRQRVLVAPTRACGVCSARRREAGETVPGASMNPARRISRPRTNPRRERTSVWIWAFARRKEDVDRFSGHSELRLRAFSAVADMGDSFPRSLTWIHKTLVNASTLSGVVLRTILRTA